MGECVEWAKGGEIERRGSWNLVPLIWPIELESTGSMVPNKQKNTHSPTKNPASKPGPLTKWSCS